MPNNLTVDYAGLWSNFDKKINGVIATQFCDQRYANAAIYSHLIHGNFFINALTYLYLTIYPQFTSCLSMSFGRHINQLKNVFKFMKDDSYFSIGFFLFIYKFKLFLYAIKLYGI